MFDESPILPTCDQCARCIDREIAMTCVVDRDLTDPANIAYERRRTELLAHRRRLDCRGHAG